MKALSIVPMGNVEGLAERLAAMQREMATIHSDVYSMRQALSGVHAHEHHAMKQFAEVQRDQHTLLERMVLIESQIEKEIRQLQLHNDSQYALLSSEGQNLLSLKNMLMDALGELRGYDVQRPDYALYSNGANVIGYLTHPQGSLKPSFFSSLKRGATVKPREPETALHHDTNPGHCWPFRGTRGQLGVRLLKPVHIDAVTVDHAKMEQTIDMASAPRWMEVWGRVEGKENLERWEEYRKRFEPDVADGEVVETQVASHSPKTEHEPHVLHLPRLPNGDQYVRIASFEFNANSRRNIQTFSVLQDALDLGITFQTVVLNIDGNWGNDEYTCLYRFRVHGSVEVNSSHM
jgi:SUN domain-containing protein 1/2